MRTTTEDGWPMPVRLPTVHIEGEDYFFDGRLREFRTKTPPIRPFEIIRFESVKGRRMLEECILLECRRCGRVAAVLRDSNQRTVECVRCGERVSVWEAAQDSQATK